ncbi:hypothetical protein BGZ76_010099 [Entomortierella beljakovae]|nr:hypothetical protein BGZ76_010099 [Entomortierella beljakovae]
MDGTTYNQIYSLDLTTQVTQLTTKSEATWRELGSGIGVEVAPLDYGHSAIVTSDQKSLVFWGVDTGISIYDIASNSWNVRTISQPGGIKAERGQPIIMDPRTGLIYRLMRIDDNTNGWVIYDLAKNVTQTLPVTPSSLRNPLVQYSLAWSTIRNSILLYSGVFLNGDKYDYFNEDFYEYTPENNTWSVLPRSSNPGGVGGHCMVPALNGTKMVLFGGFTDFKGQSFGMIYIWDVYSRKWTQGKELREELVRNNMACSVSGSNFIAWGGSQYNRYSDLLSTPIIYNINSGVWTLPTSLEAAENHGVGMKNVIGGMSTTLIFVSMLWAIYI